jgi:putative MFS transporter
MSVIVTEADRAQGIARIVARIERIPFTGFHLRARVIIGTATFFDAFDALAIAFVLPVLIRLWQLTPGQIGALISVGFVGQIVGAILLGWLAERRGRMPSLLVSVGIFSVFSLLAALSWDYASLFVFRTLQGIGLGGEVPVAAAYINEISKAKGRGRFVLLYETVFAVGIFVAALVGWWVVPTLGWRAMFVIGGLPALLVIVMRVLLPESPRWLADRGRLDDAERVVARIEDEARRGGVALPEPVVAPAAKAERTRLGELFQGRYRRRTLTVWVMWFSAYFATYGLTTWLPSLYLSVFKLPLAQALKYSLVTTGVAVIGAVVTALLIDRTGRKPWLATAFFVGAFFLLVLWLAGATSALQVMVLGTAGYTAIATIALGLYLYSPEIYPTRMRALGSSVGSAWLRVASAIGPLVMGLIVAQYPLSTAFLLFGLVCLVGGVVTAVFGVETKGRVLEELSP